MFTLAKAIIASSDLIYGAANVQPVDTTETEIEFMQDESGRWYIVKANAAKKRTSRFRTVHQVALVTMSTDEIMALTRGE